MLLSELIVGQKARLLDFGDTPIRYRSRLLSLGLTKGTEVSVVRRAPLGCPVALAIRGTIITLRLEETTGLKWEQL